MEWRDVVGHEGLYKVNRSGGVISTMRDGCEPRGCPKDVKSCLNGPGYRTVHLYNTKDGDKTRLVHHLVAGAFIGPRPDGYVIDHIDENRGNTHVSNLQYITHSQNIAKSTVSSSGVSGVTWVESRKRWKVSMADRGRTRFILHTESLKLAGIAARYIRPLIGGNLGKLNKSILYMRALACGRGCAKSTQVVRDLYAPKGIMFSGIYVKH